MVAALVKRSKPLRRQSRLKQGEKQLAPDPEKVREFLRRGRASAAGSLAASARAGARKVREKRAAEGPLSSADWRVAVFEASGGRCMMTGARADDAFDRRFHAHHVVPKDELRARGLGAHVWDPRNGVLVTAGVHMAHEHQGGEKRIPGGRLPACVWEFAQEMDATDGTSWATSLVRRLHPS